MPSLPRKGLIAINIDLCTRAAILWVVALSLMGCATVDPAPDYARAGETISGRTGSADVYDPAGDGAIEARVSALLDGGLTADEAVSVALLNNHALQALFFEIGVSRAEVAQAGLFSNPTLMFSVLIPSGGGRSKMTYGLAQELAELWQIPQRKTGAKAKLDRTMLEIVRAAVATAARTKVAYYTALAARDAEANARESEALIRRALDVVENRHAAGDVSELDVNRVRASLLGATTAILSATQEFASAKATLDMELGLSFREGQWTLGDALEAEAEPVDDDAALIAMAADNALDLTIAEQNMAMAAADLAVARRGVFPSVKAGINAERTAQRAIPSRVEQGLAALLKTGYRSLLSRTVGRPVLAFGVLAAAIILSVLAIFQLGQGFLPKFQETDFLMHWVEKPGIGIEAMNRITKRASDELMAIPGVRNFGSHIGRAEVADEVVGPNFTELWISIDPEAGYETTVKKVQDAVDGYPGLHRDLLTYLSERIKEVLTGASASIVVRIFGPELDGLLESANRAADAMREVPGVKDLKVESQVLVPQITVRPRPEAARIYGVTEADIRKAERVFVGGLKTGEIYSGQRITDVVVWGTDEARGDIAALRSLLVETPSGMRVPLQDIADVEIVPTPNMIKREQASRRIDVTCNVEGADLGAVARAIEEKVRAIPFGQGYYPEFLGEYEARQTAQNRLFALALVALAGILVLLQSDFQSTRLVSMIFLSFPFALAGGVLSLGSLVGFVAVFGIAARNGIMLVSHFRYLEREEGQAFGEALVLRAAEERLAPILMTSLATALALAPIAYGGNQPGYEIEYPMALVILGGLVSSTILNLFLLPAFYLKFGRVNEVAE